MHDGAAGRYCAACGAAKFREETSKKADSATRGRIAAVHNLTGDRSWHLQKPPTRRSGDQLTAPMGYLVL
jgi:hypothetical protein